MLLAVDSAMAAAQAAGDRSLTLANHAPVAVAALHVSSTRTDDWGEDRLRGAALPPGGALVVHLGRGTDCRFDVLVVYADGRTEELDDVDVCAAGRLVVDASRAEVDAPPAGAAHDITLTDRAPLDIAQVYLSPAPARQWGDDLLAGAAGDAGGDRTLPAGGSLTLAYRGTCLADLRVVFENDAAEERRGLNVCARPSITIAPGWTTRMDAPDGLMLLNRTGTTIVEFYAYPDGADWHGPDLLAGRVAADGSDTPLEFGLAGLCRATLRAVLEGHHADLVRSGMDLCATHEVTFSPGGNPTIAQDESRSAR